MLNHVEVSKKEVLEKNKKKMKAENDRTSHFQLLNSIIGKSVKKFRFYY